MIISRTDVLIVIIVIIAVIIAVIANIVHLILRSPFQYPYFVYHFDVSGRRNPHIDELIDDFIISGKFYLIQEHQEKILEWKDECKRKIEKSKLKNYRNAQFQKCLDDKNAYWFALTRVQTRYRQRNYVKESYKVHQSVDEYTCSFGYLVARNNKLEAINYEMPLRKYNIKNQRKLMTKELRKKIIVRDNYTCQICGKYMPDEVGLQIDHIVPVSKGGKTVLSNLQVTCSKCNGSKKDKMLFGYDAQDPYLE